MPDCAIHTIDLNFLSTPHAIASFAVLGPNGATIIETGPSSTLPALLEGLQALGVRPADVRDVLVTHIHLDHGGAAGWWAQRGARVHVHHIGAPHLMHPSKLLASARRIYGDQMDPLWGEFLAAPPERVRALHDGDVVEAGGLKFLALDTPGHARHHMLYQLGEAAFTGDLAGIRLSGRAYVRLPAPPPEFDLEAWLASIARVRARKLSRLYLTHFGLVDEVDAHWSRVETLLAEYAQRVRDDLARGAGRDAIVARFGEWEEARQAADGLDAQARALYAGVGPVDMSVDGLLRYWSKRL